MSFFSRSPAGDRNPSLIRRVVFHAVLTKDIPRDRCFKIETIVQKRMRPLLQAIFFDSIQLRSL
jgi:hypothetical protein